MLLHTGSAGNAILAWILAGIIALLGAVSYAELGTAIPSSGGEYTYVVRTYGSLAGFIYIWSTGVVTKPGSLAIISLVCGEYILKPFYTDAEAPAVLSKAMSLFILCSITMLNAGSVRWAMRLQEGLTILKTVALILIGMLGFVTLVKNYNTVGTPCYDNFRKDGNKTFGGGGGGGGAGGTRHGGVGGGSAAEFGVAVLAGLWSYDGWNNLYMPM